MQRDAVISRCGRYRYRLARRWGDGPAVSFVMLNPSTADAEHDDATVRRCTGYARAWGYGALLVFNLYAYRARRPADLWTVDDPVGPDNDRELRAAADVAADLGTPVVAAWGVHARPDRVERVCGMYGMSRLTALATTRNGQPRHPLYLPAGLTPRPWEVPTCG